MFGIKVSSDWKISDNDITSEEIYLNRRQFIENTGKLGGNLLALRALSKFLFQQKFLLKTLPLALLPDGIKKTLLTWKIK